MTRRDNQAGFSVIEALVAVAIVAVALLALATLQIQVSRTFARQRAAQEEIVAHRNAMAFLRDLNVLERPVGAAQLGGVRLDWTATPISPPTRATNAGAGDGAFEIVLYRVNIALRAPDGAAMHPMVIEKLGWRPVAAAEDALTTRE